MFLPCPEKRALSVILSVQKERTVNGGSEISFEGTKYQLRKGKEKILMRKGEKVTVLRSASGVLQVLKNDELYELEVSPKEVAEPTKTAQISMDSKKEATKNTPAAGHPWRVWNKRKTNRAQTSWQGN